jgi:hypothetical protein
VGVVAGTSRTYRTYRTATVTRGYLHRLSPARFLLHTGRGSGGGGGAHAIVPTATASEATFVHAPARATGGAWGRRHY